MKPFHKYHLIIKITLCERVNYPDFIDKKTDKQFGPSHWFGNAGTENLNPSLPTRNLKLFSPCY